MPKNRYIVILTPIIEKSNNSLIVTKTMALSSEIKRKVSPNNNVIHYHQLIWDTGKQIGMPLSLNNWSQYDDISIFWHKKQLIKKYSKIFVDIEKNALRNKWIEILKRYFLKEDGEIFILNELSKGKSFRLNSSITNLTNNILNYEIENNNSSLASAKTFYILTDKFNISKNISRILKTINKKSDVTILTSTQEDIQNIEENLEYKKHLSFITKEEEYNFNGTSLDFHWFKKNRTLDFNPNKKKLKMATIKAFKGLESEIVFFIITENTSEKDLYSAITRTKDSLYIFNYNSNYSDKLRLNIDEIVGGKNICHPLFSASCNIAFRKPEFADTPPAIAICFMPVMLTALSSFFSKMEIIVFCIEAARSALCFSMKFSSSFKRSLKK